MEAHMTRFSFLLISLGLLVIGLVLVFSSVGRSVDAANAYLGSHGGSMDTAQFTILLQEYIHTYQWTGGILAVLGGLGLLHAMEFRGQK
jgi:hypothetical protein